MPICPGCEQRVSYDQLDVHERYCAGLRGTDWTGGREIANLEHRLAHVEQLLSQTGQFEIDTGSRRRSPGETRRMR